MSMIDVQSLRVDYDEVSAVKDVSLAIPPGQIYGFVGPNGAGKTSTIKALAGVLEPTFGRIGLDGHDLETQREQALQGVGYMPDFAPVYEDLKVWEYLDVFGAAYGMTEEARTQAVDRWLRKVDLFEKSEALIKGLSRGMRQRIVFAKTLLPGPKILLLDEPASGLDPLGRRQMRDILKEAAAGGTTILISSHILTELSDFCDAIGILEQGRLIMSGTIKDISDQFGTRTTLRIRLIEGSEAPQAFWDALSHYQVPHEDVRRERDYYLITCPFAEEQQRYFLKTLVEWNVPVTDYRCQADDVEEIFLRVGAKEVS